MKNILSNLIKDNPKSFPLIVKYKFPDINMMLHDIYREAPTMAEKCYMFINDYTSEDVKCIHCLGNRNRFYSYARGYANSCTNKACIAKSNKIKSDALKSESKHPLQNPNIRAKAKESLHDVDWSLRNQKSKITSMNRYGVDHPTKSKESKDRRKATLMEKYGVDHPMQ